MQVSVIVPACNAGQTLADTLDSLLAQTFPDWEAIVVDDGSVDQTRKIASEFAARDPRIRLVSQPQAGESEARNTGIRLARFDWLLFLDSDDWLLPHYLERSVARLEADSSLDAVICGWTRVAPDGRLGEEKHCAQSEDVFELATRACPFAIHACLVRRSLVDGVGCFDASLQTCSDWDLWQRIARQGARFGTVPEVLARYRMRPGSAGLNGPRLLRDGLSVIRRGHSPDSRLVHAASRYAQGADPEHRLRAEYHYCCWAAGMMIGAGQDASRLLESLTQQESDIDPRMVALCLFESILLPACGLTSDWPAVWPTHKPLIDRFLGALEAKSLAPGIAVRSRRLLERLVLARAPVPRPLLVGRSYAVKVDLTEPIPNLFPPGLPDRLICELEIEGEGFDSLELPICDGFVPAYVLADAIVSKFAWLILGRFWRRTLYRQLAVGHKARDISVWRDGECLAQGLPEEEEALWTEVHNRIGWAIFSEQLWKFPADVQRQKAADGWFFAEVTEDLPELEVTGDHLACVPTVGGVPLGVVIVPVNGGILRPEQLQLALLNAVGFEPCRVAVREAVLGRPFEEPPLSLWERLKTAAAVKQAGPVSAGSGVDAATRDNFLPPALLEAPWPEESKILLGPRLADPIATSASRRAVLPADAAREILQATAGRQAVLCMKRESGRPARVVYAPDLLPVGDVALSARVVSSPDVPACPAAPLCIASLPPAIGAEPDIVTDRLPILMYHSVAPKGDPRASRYRITPDAFQEQLRYLAEAGYRTVTLEAWRLAMMNERPLPGRAVLLTFDDGYVDFEKYAWPLLRQYGFAATLFVVVDNVGKNNRWDQLRTKELDLLGWKSLRSLQSQGIEVASHSASHAALSTLSPFEVVLEGVRSRTILERELDKPVNAFAYPYGAHDDAVQHLIGACGYVFGLTCDFALSSFFDPLLALPRLEITGSDSLEDFVKKIEGPECRFALGLS